MPSAEHKEIRGHVDGYRDGRIYGWAWQPSAPDDTLLIEVLVDGVVVAETAAWMPRADLSEAGIGDGRHGFDVPVELDVSRLRETPVVVRVKEGEALPGALVQGAAAGAAAPLDAEVAAFIHGVLTSSGAQSKQRPGPSVVPAPTRPAVKWQPRDHGAMNFIVYGPVVADRSVADKVAKPETRTNKLLARLLKKVLPPDRDLVDTSIPEDSRIHYLERVYSAVAPALNSLFGRLGKVHVARDPVADVNRIYESCVARGESCLLLYYGLPHQMVLGSRCPVMPIIAWDHPSIPVEAWGGDPRNDWRQVLAQTAGVITLSTFAATAVRKAMGEGFPVVAVPVPVWDRSPAKGRKPPLPLPQQSARVELDNLAFDSRVQVFKLGDPLSQPPRRADLAATGVVPITLDGVVFSAIVTPRDGTEDWQQLVSAFIVEFAADADATLVLKMAGRSLSEWWWELTDLLTRSPTFHCRVLVLQDFVGDAGYAELFSVTHWIVNSSKSEAVCLPSLEFMSAGRPAVTPAHTAMADFIDTRNAIIVRSEESYWWWPHDAEQHFATVSQSVDWTSLCDGMREAYRITKSDGARYAAMSEAALATMQRLCADTVVLGALAQFLGVRTEAAASVSKLAPA